MERQGWPFILQMGFRISENIFRGVLRKLLNLIRGGWNQVVHYYSTEKIEGGRGFKKKGGWGPKI